MTSTLCTHPSRSASSTIRAIRGVDREPDQAAADPGEARGRSAADLDGVQLLEQGHAVADRAHVRRLDERERGDVAEAIAVIWRMTEARLVRRISGSVYSGRLSKSSSL